MTFNILHGRSLEDGRVDVERFAAAVRRLDPDVLALQEVDRDHPRSHLTDLTAVAGEAMGAVDSRFVAAMAGDPVTSWVPVRREPEAGTAAYGVALLSRYPVQTWRSLPLPRIRPPFPWVRRDLGRLELRREELRAAVVAQLRTPEGLLSVACTHLSFVPGWGQLQLSRIRRALVGVPGPAVIMGDLNLTRLLPPRVTGYRALAGPLTFPADRPRRQIDHVLVRGDVGDVVAADATQLPLSDHRALVVELDRSRLRRS